MRHAYPKQMTMIFIALVMLIYGCFTFWTVKLAWDYDVFIPLSYVNGDTVIT